MGEYSRLNKLLREQQENYRLLQDKSDKTEDDYEALADLYQSIGEIEGALFEMAEIDGLEDPYEAFDYHPEDFDFEYKQEAQEEYEYNREKEEER